VDKKIPVLFVSLEQARAELGERVLCARAEVDSYRVRRGMLDSDELERLAAALAVLRPGKLFIDDASHQSLQRVTANARRLVLRQGVQALVVDYLQLIDPENPKVPRHEQVGTISRRLKQIARQLNIAVLALAQLNRAVEERAGEKPRLSDLRESGSIEADADTVMLMHRPPGETTRVNVNVAKQRNGPTGELSLIFEPEYMRFQDQTEECPFVN
jgi:replicative DNA helicase